jgi:DNA mismatch endonuclease (patch repair protein)
MDTLSKQARSERMRRVRSHDTSPELIVRKEIFALGFRFSLHARQLPGAPDIVLNRHHKIVLVHGCFWHRHKGCRHARTPKSRLEYWLPKFEANEQRDLRVRRRLARLGWRTLVVWECQTRNREVMLRRLTKFLSK